MNVNTKFDFLLLLFSVTAKLLSEPHVTSLICGNEDNTFGIFWVSATSIPKRPSL